MSTPTSELVERVREALAFDYLGPDSNDMDGEKWGQDPEALAALTDLAARLEAAERAVKHWKDRYEDEGARVQELEYELHGAVAHEEAWEHTAGQWEKRAEAAEAHAAELERDGEAVAKQRDALHGHLGRIRAAAESDPDMPRPLRDFILRETGAAGAGNLADALYGWSPTELARLAKYERALREIAEADPVLDGFLVRDAALAALDDESGGA